MKRILSVAVAVLLVLTLAACEEEGQGKKSSNTIVRKAHADPPGLANPDWERYGVDLPERIPVLVNEIEILETGLFHVLFHVMCVNNMNGDCLTCDVPNIVFMAQLWINRSRPLTGENWLKPGNWPEYHVGKNATPWAIHYADLDMSLYLELYKGDRIEVWIMSDTDEGPYPTGGAYYYELPMLRNFQVVRMGDLQGIPVQGIR